MDQHFFPFQNHRNSIKATIPGGVKVTEKDILC